MLKEEIKRILPEIVYIGNKPYCQPAYLNYESFEYVVSNEVPRNTRSHTHFVTLKDFQDWTTTVNYYIKLLEENLLILQNMHDISKIINTEFNYEYLPKINLYFNYEEYKNKSICMTLKTLLQMVMRRVEIKNVFITFLRNNDLYQNHNLNEVNVSKIKENIKQLNKKYPEYKKKLEVVYNSKYDTLEAYSILQLSNRCEIPFILVRKFLEEKRKK